MRQANRRFLMVGGTLLLIMALALSLGIAGCGEESTETTAAPVDTTASDAAGGDEGTATEDVLIGYAAMQLTDPFQVAEQSMILAEAERLGIEYLEPTNANGDSAKQVTDVRTLVDQGVTGLVVIPWDAKAIVPAVEYAVGEGVPVVTADTTADGGGVYCSVLADNILMGEAAAEEIGRVLGGTGKVLEIQGELTQSAGRDRTLGFETVMAEKFPDIEVIAKPGEWKADVGTAAIQTALTADPDIDAIFIQSDAVYLPGLLSVLASKGLDAKVGEPGHIYVISIDGTPAGLDALRADQIDAVISQPLDMYAKYCIQYLLDALAGKEIVLGPTDHGSEIVLSAGGVPEDHLPSPVITKATVEDPNLWGNVAAQ